MITTRCRTGTAVTIVVLAVLALLSLAAPAAAGDEPVILAERATADTVLVRAGDVVDEDLYAGGNRVLIEGTIQGDLTVAAFRELVISGTVEGDVIGYSPLVDVTGNIGGSLRVAADLIRMQGQINEDLFAGARSTIVTGTVGRDIQTWGLSLDVRGTVGRDIRGWVLDKFRLGGSVGRDVEVTVGRLEVMDGTRIGGSLGYRSDQEADLGADVEIERVLTRRDRLNPNVRVQAILVLTQVLVVLAIVALGFVMFWLAPRSLRVAVESVQSRTALCLLLGLVVAVVPLAVVVLITVQVVDSSPELALPSAVIGLPIGLLLVSLVVFGLLVSPVPVFTAVGSKLTRGRRSALFSYLVGMVILVLLMLVPVLRVLVLVLVAALGLGAWTLGMIGARGTHTWAVQTGRPQPSEQPSEPRWEEIEPTGPEPPKEETETLSEMGEPFDGELQLPFEEEEEESPGPGT